MKNVKKVMILVVIFAMILSISVWAISVSEWELSKLSERYETKETKGALVMKNCDGETYILEFDMETGMVSMTEIDEDGYVDVEVVNIIEDPDYEFCEIYFVH